MADNNAFNPNQDFADRFPADFLELLQENNEAGVEIRKENIFDDGSAFLLYNVLTDEECESLKAAIRDMGLRPLDQSISHYRVNDKAYAEDKNVAKAIFDRVLPHLGDGWQKGKSVERGVPEDMGDRQWNPYGLNPHFRICRYRPGGFFGAHHDKGYFVSSNNRSIQTFMLYLNDDFDGGSTRFFTENQPHVCIYILRFASFVQRTKIPLQHADYHPF
mmetsp:Transcript_877/g.1066  ORF Transcript_877/g.1066 Transcript_877/m.1066 type:complete len:218 (+) Transcript_877:61-714(+)